MLACSLLVPQKALHFLSFSTEVQDRNDLLAEHQCKQVRFMAFEDFVVLFAKSVYKVKISENTCLRGIFPSSQQKDGPFGVRKIRKVIIIYPFEITIIQQTIHIN